METSTILTIGLLGIWCSMCVDDKDTSDQRMLGYALGFGLLFILVCKDLYSEDECSRYEYLDDDDKRTDDQKKADDEKNNESNISGSNISFENFHTKKKDIKVKIWLKR